MSDLPEKNTVDGESTEESASTVFSDPTQYKKAPEKQKRNRLPVIIAAVLAVAVLSGGTVAVIKLIPEKEESTSSSAFETIKVLELKTDDIKSVTVTNENGTFKLYSVKETAESTDSSSSDTAEEVNWYLDGYEKDVINTSSVKSIATKAATVTAVREITAKSAAECGLESPAVRADIVTNDGAELSLLIGGESPDGTGVYIKLSTDDKIYIAEDSLKETFVFDALSLAKTEAVSGIAVTDAMKASYTDDKGALTSFDSITVTGKKFPEKVIITPNTDENLSQYAAYMTTSPTKRIADNVDGIFDLFKSGVSVSGVYSFDTSATERKKLGLDDPDLTAEIKIGDFSLSYSFKQQSDGNYAVWYDGAKLINKISASNLSFIDYKASDFYASWVCLQSINELSNFTVKTADKVYSFDIVYDDSKDAKETYVITYNGKKLTASDFQSFYQECISLSCTDFTVEKLSVAPQMTFVFTYSDTSRAPTSVEFKKASETKYQYSIDGIDMGKINSSALNKILRQAEKLTS